MEQIQNPVVEIEMKDGGTIVLELFPDKAPLTVANFADLVQTGFYDGLSFHRVVKDFMIQGGSSNNSCAGGSEGFTIKGEFAQNGVDTGLKHTRGTISMARSMHPNSASTQFFIMHRDSGHLDGQYAAFGRMTDGFDVLDRIAEVETGPDYESNPPLVPQVISRIVLKANGYKLPENLERIVTS